MGSDTRSAFRNAGAGQPLRGGDSAVAAHAESKRGAPMTGCEDDRHTELRGPTKKAARVAVPLRSERTRGEPKYGSAKPTPCELNLMPPTSRDRYRHGCSCSDHQPRFRPEVERRSGLILTYVCEIPRRSTHDTENPAVAGIAAIRHRTHSHPTAADRGDRRRRLSRRNHGRCLLDGRDRRSKQNREANDHRRTYKSHHREVLHRPGTPSSSGVIPEHRRKQPICRLSID
jgi:hypothetical protein